MANVLIIDDEEVMCTVLAEVVSRGGWSPVCVKSLHRARELAEDDYFDIVLLDIYLPDGNGLEVLPDFVNTHSQPEVIIMTGYGHGESADLALKHGAWDYLTKPFNQKKITLSIKRALEFRKAKLARQKHRILKRDHIVGTSLAINEALSLVGEAARGEHSVLITGETGTGKELFARAIHINSQRAKRHFIVVDCTSLSEHLIESSLFGHVKGAFTDAYQNRTGLIEMAHQGTLFLDEIGELPLAIQKKLLRVLEEKRFRPIGSTTEKTSDFRLVSATNRDLEKMVAAGAFRDDLLYRIKSQELRLPPLRHRKEDISELVNHYMSRICRRMNISPKTMQPEFLNCLLAYDWPGNVRELVNVMDQVLCASQELPTLFHKQLPMEIRSAHIRQESEMDDQPAFAPADHTEPPELRTDLASPLPSWQKYRQMAEKAYFSQLLAETNGDISKMQKIARMSKSRLYDLINKHQLVHR